MLCKLFLPDGSEIISKEGTTQGDNCASGFYSISTFIIIKDLANIEDSKQIWFADDAGSAGKISALRKCWDRLNLKSYGPQLGYIPNPPKTVLVVKEGLVEVAKEVFHDTGIQITSEGVNNEDHLKEGHRYLGGAIGTKAFQEAFVRAKIESWCKDIEKLSEVARREPSWRTLL